MRFSVDAKFGHAGLHVQLAAILLDHGRDVLPQLAGTEFGIEEALDQRGLDTFLAQVAGVLLGPGEGLLHKMFYRACQRQAFDALRAPLRADVARMNAPDLFRIRLEE